ncbi:MAG TPA: YciK family oxidoreductase [Steroidobacteraceae bacterium]|nr:YciK family oxidoreductase [Steroidobacteraceae bacterium]
MNLNEYKPSTSLLDNHIILITGASDGIGKAIALACAAHGATIILHGRNVKRLEAAYDAIIAAKGKRPSILPLDFEKAGPAEYEALASAIEKEFGRLDGLVHNAGMLGERAPIEHHDVAKWLRTIHVNVNAPFILTKYCLPLLKKSSDASIVFTSSGVVSKPRAYWGAYLPSKWASDGLMHMLADELEKDHIRVNSINPGAVRTNMRLQAYPAEDRSKLRAPEELAAAYLYLLGPDGKGLTSQTIFA